MSKNHFNRVGGLKPRRNVFDLSYRKNFTCDMGQLIPILADEMVPGDHWKIGNELVIRFQPLAAPIMHEITATVHYFFVPYRILWDLWEQYISQGELGQDPLPIPIPRFVTDSTTIQARDLGSLWDYFGLPVNPYQGSAPGIKWPIDMPWRAYNMIYNEYYRDQDLQTESPLLNGYVLNRNWKKDYFTSARPFLQKGQAPALPVDLSGSVFWDTHDSTPFNYGSLKLANAGNQQFLNLAVSTGATVPGISGNAVQGLLSGGAIDGGRALGVNYSDIAGDFNTKNTLIGAAATSFTVSDLRLAFQTQKWLERNARAGTRYTEFLRAHFGVSPTDSRLQRPEYIGGTSMPISISEVVQTSESNLSPQGTMAGHGLAADGQFAGSYHAQEFGIVIGLLSVMPKRAYQQGINRQWLRELPTDFYFPEFSHLSEQAIMNVEIYATFGRGSANQDGATFGYAGQYDEMRVKHDMVCSEMRKNMWPSAPPDLSYWNMASYFNTGPNLNSQFITADPRKDIFDVQDVPGLIVNCQNLIRAARPMPLLAEPGLIDHN